MNAKRFSKKLLSLFLAVLMALTCFTGVITAFGAEKADADYHDDNLAYNILTWAETTDDQTCTALLDYADEMLAGVNYHLAFSQSIVIDTIKIDATIDSVDGCLDLVDQASAIVEKYKGTIGGDVKNIDLTCLAGMSREKNTSKQIVMGVAQLLYKHTSDIGGKNILKQFLTGDLNLGLVNNFVDLYDIIGKALGFSDTSYKSNLVYNLVHKLFVDGFYKDKTSDDYAAAQNMKIDDLAFKLLDNFLFDTLKDKDEVLFMKDFTLSPTDNANTKLLEAFKLVWEHTLEYLFGTINYDKFGFDTAYSDYCTANDLEYDYSESSITNWIANDSTNIQNVNKEAYTSYMEKNPTATLTDYVKDYLTFDRTTVNTDSNAWKNIDGKNLFNKVLYSPLANALGVETGVLNLMIQNTNGGKGNFHVDFDFSQYTSVSSIINDFLITLLYQLFPGLQSANLGLATSNATNSYTKLVPNALLILQWVADKTDVNILHSFYTADGNSSDSMLTETNVEDAMVPLLTSIVSSIDITDQIHDTEWDACHSAEDVAFVCLKEYLAYVLPDKDYSVLPGATIENGHYNATLEGTILPLVRDALAYVISPYVPIVDGSGNEIFDVYTSSVNSDVTIWQIFNCVVCYYGLDKGVANLLGFVDFKGEGKTISRSNTLWENLDVVVNAAIPQLSALISTNASDVKDAVEGKISTEALIYDGIVKGVLNIADTKEYDGEQLGGISYFINLLGYGLEHSTIFNSKAIINIVYDFLADLVNFVLGARDSQDNLGNVLPETTSATPFDDLLQVGVIAGTSSGNDSGLGVINKLIVRLCWALGVDGRTDTAFSGIMFAITAVNSFIPAFVPQLSEHSLEMGTASLTSSAITSVSADSSFTDTLVIKNGSYGLNTAWKDINGETQQNTRYSMTINSVTSDSSNVTVGAPKTTSLAAEAKTTCDISGSVANGDNIVKFTVNYNIMRGSETIKTGLECSAYLYTSTTLDWFNTVYNSSNQFNTTIANSGASNDYCQATGAFKTHWLGGQFYAQYPKYVVMKTSSLSDASNFQVWLYNHAGGEYSVDGVYAYMDGDTNKALATIDKTNGDILNYNYLDYSEDDGKTWTRGAYTNDTVPSTATRTRAHVAMTFAEATSAGLVTASSQNEDGTFNYVCLTPSDKILDGNMTTQPDGAPAASDPTWSTPVDGIYFAMGKETVANNSEVYKSFLAYDGETTVKPGKYDMNIQFYRGEGAQPGTMSFYIADDTDNETLAKYYDSSLSYASSYLAEDFSDYDGSSSAVRNALLATLQDSLKKSSTIMNKDTALTVSASKNYIAKTESTTNELGDIAYMQATAAELPVEQRVDAFVDGNGYAYLDSDFRVPYYNRTEVTDATASQCPYAAKYEGETNDKFENGKYYMSNALAYKYAWDTTTYPAAPYYAPTTTLDTNEKGEQLYNATTFSYRDADGEQVTSQGAWVVKVADTDYKAIPNEYTNSDNRGVYLQAYDSLSYAMDNCNKNVDATAATSIRERVTDIRDELNETNFDILSYQKMVKVAKKAESLLSIDGYYNYYLNADVKDEKPVEGAEVVFSCLGSELQTKIDQYNKDKGYQESDLDYLRSSKLTGIEDRTQSKYSTKASSVQINAAIGEFNSYMSHVIERGYIGDKLEAEVECATNGVSYDNVTVDGDNVKVPTSSTAKYGTVAADGTLTNTDANGKQAYTEESWNTYISTLKDAVTVAQTGESSSYSYQTKAYYVPTDKEGYTASASNCYTARTALMRAENELDPYEAVSSDVTVTGTLYMQTDLEGTKGAVAPGISIYDEQGTLLGTTNTDGTYSIKLPANADATIKFAGDTTIDRTVTVPASATDVAMDDLTIIVCDYNHDVKVNTLDKVTFASTVNSNAGDSTYNVYCDLNGDGKVNTLDKVAFSNFVDQDVTNPYNF